MNEIVCKKHELFRHRRMAPLVGLVFLLISLLTTWAGAAITVHATISTYAAFLAQNPGVAPGLLIFMRSDNNDYNNASGAQWITIDQNKTYTFTLPWSGSTSVPAGYYWTGFNHNGASQAQGCVVTGLPSIMESGTYLADGSTVNMTITCTMPPAPAAVTTQAVSGIGSTMATGNGNITSLGSPNPTAHGICWNTTGSPTLSSSKTDKGAASATGAFTASMTGLLPGTTYYVRAFAVNTSGTQYGSVASFTTSKLSQTIDFTNPGAHDFGTAPTLSATATSGDPVSFTSGASGVCSITSGGALTFLSTGTCTVHADQAGNASYAAATRVTHSFEVNAVVPGAPTIGSATGSSGQVTVSFIAPVFVGGAAITGYTVTASSGSITATGLSSPIVVTGLSNGVAYTFKVTATNSAGTSAASLASNEIKLQGSQTIDFTNPGTQTFGSAPTLSATATSGEPVSFTSGTSGVCSITSGGALTFLTTGTCTVHADQVGNAAYVAATRVTHSFEVSAVVPSAPTIGSATSSSGQVVITFTAPTFEGGSTITGYTVTANAGSITATGVSSPIIVTGLSNGVAYSFTVTASNSVGTSIASLASNEITLQGSQAIAFNDLVEVTYGAADFAPSVQASSNLDVTLTSSNLDVAQITESGLVHIVGAGSTTITTSQPGNAAYLAAEPVSKVLNVAKALLTITALNDTITIGDSEPSLQLSFEGFVNTDNISALSGLDAIREPGSDVGMYKITPSAEAVNYEIKFVEGWFVVLDLPASNLAVLLPNVSVRRVPGGLSLTGLRGNIEIFSLRGERVRTLHVDRDGVYALELPAERYVLRSGKHVWTIAPVVAQ